MVVKGVAMTQSCRKSKPGNNACKIAVKHMGAMPGIIHTIVMLAKCKVRRKTTGGDESYSTHGIKQRGGGRLVSVDSKPQYHKLLGSREKCPLGK